MFEDFILRLVSVLTPDDVKDMKNLGCEDTVMELLAAWDKLNNAWSQAGVSDSQVYAEVQRKLYELRSTIEGLGKE